MYDFFLSDSNLPFTIALSVVAALFILEIIGLIIGFSIFGDSDADFDADVDGDFDHHLDHAHADVDSGVFGTFVNWIGFGRLPVLAFVALFCGVFGIIGLILNQISTQTLGIYLNTSLAMAAAFVLTLPVVSRLTLFVARILPREESNAVELRDLLGREALIIQGNATYETSASASCKDMHGVLHHFSVRPVDPEAVLHERSKVRLENLSDQGFFYVSPII